ncbi:MAG TPA: glycosyltransferase family 2 protein, partial [Chryseosolibacter sp.]
MEIAAHHPSFLLALPMYNEEAYAEKCIRTIFPVLDSTKIRNAIVAVNDGSRDRTLSILEEIQPEFERLYVVNHAVNGGYGASIRTAYKFAIDHEYDYVLFMDADLTQDPLCILNFLPHMANGIDLIKASRYIEGSRVIGVPHFRVVISSFGNAFARLAFHLPITDYTNGFRAVKISLAKQFDLRENRFPILVEEMWQAKQLASRYAEVSYTLTTRQNEADSK